MPVEPQIHVTAGGGREDVETAGVIAPIAELNQSLMTTAVVPLQHLLRHAAGDRFVENALEIINAIAISAVHRVDWTLEE